MPANWPTLKLTPLRRMLATLIRRIVVHIDRVDVLLRPSRLLWLPVARQLFPPERCGVFLALSRKSQQCLYCRAICDPSGEPIAAFRCGEQGVCCFQQPFGRFGRRGGHAASSTTPVRGLIHAGGRSFWVRISREGRPFAQVIFAA
jgi:hypothetical protein